MSEQYRLNDHRLSAKLVPTFADRGVSRGQRNGSPRPYSRISRLESNHMPDKKYYKIMHSTLKN
jgi:hypothetical protein